MKRIALVLALAASSALAQQGSFPSAGVTASGPITPGNCVNWSSASAVADAGVVCGSGGAASAVGPTGAFQYNAGAGSFGAYTPSAALSALHAAPAAVNTYISGNWYLPPYVTVAASSALVANRISMIPLICPASMSVKAMGARVGTAVSGGNIALAIYANNPATGRPTGTPLGSTGSITTVATGPVNATPTGGYFTLPAGVYWAAVNADATAGGTVVVETQSGASGTAGYMIGSQTQGNISDSSSGTRLTLYVAQTFGTWPDLTAVTPTELTTLGSAIIQLQAN